MENKIVFFRQLKSFLGLYWFKGAVGINGKGVNGK